MKNQIPRTKESILKKSLTSLFKNAIALTIAIGLLFYGFTSLASVNNKSLNISLVFSVLIIVLALSRITPSLLDILSNIIKVKRRRSKLKALNAFQKSLGNGFSIHKDLYYEGLVNGYIVQIFIKKKKLWHLRINVYFDQLEDCHLSSFVNELERLHTVEKAIFSDGLLTYVPVNHALNDTFNNSILDITRFLKSSKLESIDMNVWKQKHSAFLEEKAKSKIELHLNFSKNEISKI